MTHQLGRTVGKGNGRSSEGHCCSTIRDISWGNKHVLLVTIICFCIHTKEGD